MLWVRAEGGEEGEVGRRSRHGGQNVSSSDASCDGHRHGGHLVPPAIMRDKYMHRCAPAPSWFTVHVFRSPASLPCIRNHTRGESIYVFLLLLLVVAAYQEREGERRDGDHRTGEEIFHRGRASDTHSGRAPGREGM